MNFLKKFEKLLAHKIWGVFIFLFFMWFMFFSTFYLGDYPKRAIDYGVTWFSHFCAAHLTNPTFSNFMAHGVVEGVGSVLSFLPNIVIMFFFISIYEVSGLSQRFALLMDKLMHGIGLHGSSFIPLLMGFGCNVPAILAVKTVPRRTDRLVTMLMIPFMSCSARLPVYILLIGTFFPEQPLLILMILYLSGVLLAILTAFIINKFIFKPPKDYSEVYASHLVMPKYRPVFKLVWAASKEYLQKIGTVVLVAVIIVWALDYYPRPETKEVPVKQSCGQEFVIQKDTIPSSYLFQLGNFISPVFKPLGFDWKMSVSLVSGLPAKEFIVSTMAVVYQTQHSENANDIKQRLQAEVYESGDRTGDLVFNKAVALSFLFFALLYMPCIATIAAIYKESKSYKWAFFTVFYTIFLAWIVAFAVYRVALWFI